MIVADRQATVSMMPSALLPAVDLQPAEGIVQPELELPAEDDLGRGSIDTHIPDAQVEGRGEQTDGRRDSDTQPLVANRLPPRRRSYMGHYAQQMLDVQKLRVATQNRIDAMERDEVPEHWMVAQRTVLADLRRLERFCERQLAKQGRGHFMATWVRNTPGLSLAGFARVIGITGPLENFATVSKLWAYMGLHVVDGHSPRRRKGESANWSPAGRVLCRQIGDAIVKVNRGPYRAAYDRKKVQYELDRPEWQQAHRHEAAMRYAVKALLKDMWSEWRRVQHDG